MAFNTVQKQTLTEAVVDQILARIKSGELKVGDALPSERQMMSMFGVSRSCVREAVQGLAMIGYIDIQPGKRSVIKAMNASTALDLEAVYALMEKQSLKELFEVRKIFEVEIAGLACQRVTPNQLSVIEECMNKYEKAATKQKPTAVFDAAFHQALAEATQNHVILKIYSSIEKLLTEGRERSEDVEHGGNLRGIKFHKRIVECIRERDMEGARTAMREHIEDVEKTALGHL